MTQHQKPHVRHWSERVRTPAEFEGESKTQAVDGNITDVNLIMERFTRTGQLPPVNTPGQYADVTELQVDLTEAINNGLEAMTKMVDLQEQTVKAKEEYEKSLQNQNETPTEPTSKPPADPPNQPPGDA